ncbi:LacI family DNA-binding transcriptional regulator [Rhodococcus sp. MEB064]|uniref:LacI family DNA-binding transcriptional regulator n=1 Tax=Rhodococcus sp. MEB064 TaxID=1587522 RepID=UPI0005AC37D3|nr:LacI family DNA-binding transcriptional regulator [Rhodococcus sp. MEB064]KIQ19523.1 LacI family transcriptional regulator [Rhodococcus sp. MEB064]
MSTSDRLPTIRTVAEHAGVSKSLVSLVLHDSPNVSDDKRAAVLASIDALGYRPNLSARSLSRQRTDIVGVLINDLRNPWFVDCLEGMAPVLESHGLTMMLGDGRADRSGDDTVVRKFTELRLDALVLVGTREPTPLVAGAATSMPTVIVASRDLELPRADVVANDDTAGSELAVRHLADLGHRLIAHVAGSFGVVAALRAASYRSTMASLGLDTDGLVETCDLTEDGGYEAATRLLSRSPRPTAVYAVNDIAAVGVMTACQEAGLAVPQDISVVGYDNTSIAQLRHVSLTSVDNASSAVGRRAAAAVIDRIARPDASGTVDLIAPSLQVRGSTAPPAGT